MIFSALRYRYICCGLVSVSITWAIIIFFYVTHLERESKANIVQQRQRLKAEAQFLGVGNEKSAPKKHLAADHENDEDDRGFVFKNENAELNRQNLAADDKAGWETGHKKNSDDASIQIIRKNVQNSHNTYHNNSPSLSAQILPPAHNFMSYVPTTLATTGTTFKR